jgi:hypothetical protein
MGHLLGWVLQLNGADKQIISNSLGNSDKLFGWQDNSRRAMIGLMIRKHEILI